MDTPTRARKQRQFLACFEELGMVAEASRRAKVKGVCPWHRQELQHFDGESRLMNVG
jgi:hypothetical protein